MKSLWSLFLSKKLFLKISLFIGCAGFSLVAVSGGYSPVGCSGFTLLWLLLLGSIDSTVGCSGVGLSCSTACEIFLDQRLNLCLLHWQADSLPPSYQEAQVVFLERLLFLVWVLY